MTSAQKRTGWLWTLEGAGLEGKSNRNAIGARVEVTVGETTYTRVVPRR